MTRSARLFTKFLLVTSLCSAPAHVWAQGSDAPSATLATDLKGPAALDYNAGRLLFRDRDYAGAFVKFQHAYELSKDPRLLWNMAACEKNLRRYARLLRLVERYQREAGARLSEQEQKEANELVRAVRQLVSRAKITVNEPGARILVDGELVGESPLKEPVLVDLGERKIRIEKPGFTTQDLTQEVTGASDIEIAVTLQRAPHEAQLTVSAPGAEAIELDGHLVAESQYSGKVASGKHSLRVAASGMKPYKTEIVLRDGETRSLDITLQKDGGSGLTALWITAGAVAAAGLGVGAYFLFRPEERSAPTTVGTIPPGQVQLP